MTTTLSQTLAALAETPGCAKTGRLLAELRFAARLSGVRAGEYDTLITDVCAYIREYAARNGAITDATVTEAERMLSPMAEVCKQYTLLFIGHAHIDMNWMWRYDETVSITLDTLKTALNLMAEFPDFRFSQSQASVYEIARKYDPELIEEIRARVASRQWEVTASTWVEADRNLPSAESVVRQELYAKRYLASLLGIGEDALRLDFEPDTFGHGENTPEFLSKAGVKWYYHCRGEDDLTLYRWRAPSGAEVLTYREPHWYLGPIDDSMADFVPDFCERFGMDTAIRVFGVGDHGGGPTRRDILRARDMMNWPIYPRVRFGTFAEFFEKAEKAENVPVAEGERNRVFTGCYTSQSRIKRGNYLAERALFDGESLSAFAHRAAGAPYDKKAFQDAWRNVLFNQFHDILPGSGVADTREYAMGLYQETYATAASAKRLSCAALAKRIDTSFLPFQAPGNATSAGAGVGFGVKGMRIGQVERGSGNTRVWHLFNSMDTDRREITELTLWDLKADIRRLRVWSASGEPVSFQVLDQGFNTYWGHDYVRVLIDAEVPALGYATYVVRVMDELPTDLPVRADPRVHRSLAPVLENDLIRAEFDVRDGSLVSLLDKRTGEQRVGGKTGFRLVTEAADLGMTSWTTGRFMSESALIMTTIRAGETGPLRSSLRFSCGAEGCALDYTVSLAQGDDALSYDVKCDWLKKGDRLTGIPRLDFVVSLAEKPESFLYDVPGGVLRRAPLDMDAPSQGMIAGGDMALLCEGKYGARGCGSEMRAAMLRSSFDPDPFPELGEHAFRFALRSLSADDTARELLRDSQRRALPLTAVSNTAHEGNLPLRHSFLRNVSGTVVTTAVKLCEEDDALIVRGVETSGEATYAEYRFDVPPKSACMVDTMEKNLPGDVRVIETRVRAYVPANSMFAIKVRL